MRINVCGQEERIDNLVELVLVKKEYKDVYAESVKEAVNIFRKIVTCSDDRNSQNLLGYFRQLIKDKEKYPAIVNLLLQDIVKIITDNDYVTDLTKYSFIGPTVYPEKSFQFLSLTFSQKDFNPTLSDELEVILKKYGIAGLVWILKYFKIIHHDLTKAVS